MKKAFLKNLESAPKIRASAPRKNKKPRNEPRKGRRPSEPRIMDFIDWSAWGAEDGEGKKKKKDKVKVKP
jgi:hypothetical protein